MKAAMSRRDFPSAQYGTNRRRQRRALRIEQLENRRQLATIVVTSLSDTIADDGQLTLREAIIAANTNVSVDGSSAGDPSPTTDTIVFAQGLAGRIQAAGYVVNEPLTINGPGASVLSIGPEFNLGLPIISFLNPADGDLTIRNLELSNGGTTSMDGGAIAFFSAGTLLIENSTLKNNTVAFGGGGAIYSVGGDVRIVGSTITGNSAKFLGGAIWAEYASVYVSDSTVSDNSAALSGGAIRADGLINVERSVVSNNSAAINGGALDASGNPLGSNYPVGFVTVVDSTIIGNRAGENGGGIAASNARIIDSTIENNMSLLGGGLHIDAPMGVGALLNLNIAGSTISSNSSANGGGGIFTSRSHAVTATLSNTTISGNSSLNEGGGIHCVMGTLNVLNSTITNNASNHDGGGIYVLGQLRADNSIIAANTANASGQDIYQGVHGTAVYRSNLIGTVDGTTIDPNVILPIPNHNRFGTDGNRLDPQLRPLADNGGPTKTHALMPNSPAVDYHGASLLPADEDDLDGDGNQNEPIPFDQRGTGFERVQFGGLDIGAYELQPLTNLPTTLVVTTAVDELDPDPLADLEHLSLREAIQLSNLGEGEQTIRFDALKFAIPTIFNITMGELRIDDGVDIQGLGKDVLTINGSSTPFGNSIFNIAGGSASIRGLTITGLNSTGTSAVIQVNENSLILLESSVSGNLIGGTAISAFGGNVIVQRSVISGNTSAHGQGSGVSSINGSILISDSTISSNTATGVSTLSGYVSVRNGTISGNTAGGVFGGFAASIEVINSTISGNASFHGGGVYAGSVTRILNSTITGNQSTSAGGGIFANTRLADLTIKNSIVAGNTDNGTGPDIYVSDDVANFQVSYTLVGSNVGTPLAESQTPSSTTGNIVGSLSGGGIVNPQIGALRDNGGPTKTHEPLVGSPAINAGDPDAIPGSNGIPPLDQRGVVRAINRIDMGSVETVPSQFDFGDAPSAYPVTLAANGARHRASSLILGRSIDTEQDGQPSPFAEGDGSDDDGIIQVASMYALQTKKTNSSFQVVASQSGKLDAWIDFNRDGDWLDAGERIFVSANVIAGDNNVLTYAIPAGAKAGETYARFRLSANGGLTPTGESFEGEVEDYQLSIVAGTNTQRVAVKPVNGLLELKYDSSDCVVQSDGTELFRAQASSFASMQVDGTVDDEIVTIDFASGFAVPGDGMMIDGGGGTNTLAILGQDTSLDLTDAKFAVTNFDRVVFPSDGANRVVIDAESVSRLSPAKKNVNVTIGPNSQILVQDIQNWRMVDPIVVTGRFVLVAQNQVGGSEKIETEAARPYTNFLQSGDINNSGNVTAADALAVIFELNQPQFSDAFGLLIDPLEITQWPGVYLDANRDGRVSASDALSVINDLYLQDLLGQTSVARAEAELKPNDVMAPSRVDQAISTEGLHDVMLPLSDKPGIDKQESVEEAKAANALAWAIGSQQRVKLTYVLNQTRTQKPPTQLCTAPAFQAVDELWTDNLLIDELCLLY